MAGFLNAPPRTVAAWGQEASGGLRSSDSRLPEVSDLGSGSHQPWGAAGPVPRSSFAASLPPQPLQTKSLDIGMRTVLQAALCLWIRGPRPHFPLGIWVAEKRKQLA